MAIEIEERGNCRILKPKGMLDSFTYESRELEAYLHTPKERIDRNYVIDLFAVDYVNSTMLGNFIAFLESVESAGFRFLLLRPPPSVEQVLFMTGLAEVVPVAANENELEIALTEKPNRKLEGLQIDSRALGDELENWVTHDRDTQGGELDRLRNKSR